MAIRVYDNGSLYSIRVGENEIAKFRRRWPASGLGALRNLWAQYDKRNGDLVDLEANGRHGAERFDGEALKALVDDMQCYAAAKLGIGEPRCAGRTDWREYLGVPRKTATSKKKSRFGT